MLRLNTLGDDALETLAAANPPDLLTQVTHVAWLDDDTLLVGHAGALRTYRATRAAGFDLRQTTIFSPQHYSAVRAGGRVWVGQIETPDLIHIEGELHGPRGPVPFPPELGLHAQIADVNARGDVAITRAEEITVIATGSDRASQVYAVADYLTGAPRLSPCGRALAWAGAACDEAVIDGQRLPLSREEPNLGPAPSYLTPLVVECYGAWWVLALTDEAGLTLTPLDDTTRGYQWALGHVDLRAVTGIDVTQTDQVRVVYELTGEGTRQVVRSEGLAPGIDLQVIQPRRAAVVPVVLAPLEAALRDALPEAPTRDVGPDGRTVEEAMNGTNADPDVLDPSMAAILDQLTAMDRQHVADLDEVKRDFNRVVKGLRRDINTPWPFTLRVWRWAFHGTIHKPGDSL